MMLLKTEKNWFYVFFVFIFAITSGLMVSFAPDKPKDWPPITPEERALTDCPEQPGAPAVCLFYEKIEDKTTGVTSAFKRIKILTPAGRDYGNIEIPYIPYFQSVEKIQVRVIPPEGEPRDYTGPILEKTAYKIKDYEAKVKTIAIPDVSPGCFIDYKYELRRKDFGFGMVFTILMEAMLEPVKRGIQVSDFTSLPATHWELQDKIFTRKARFVFEANRSVGMLFRGHCRLAWISHKLEGTSPEISGMKVELVAQNIPPFEPEELMSPGDNEKISVDVFFIDARIRNMDSYWNEAAKDWKSGSEKFMGGRNDLRVEIENIAGEETDQVSMLMKIYERVQQIRNLSFEKEMTSKEKKELKENKGAADVLERNYAYEYEITRTFVALARAAGFEANLGRVVSRDDKLFRPSLPLFYNQFDSEVALVKLGDVVMSFDPGTPFCPFGLVHWPKSNTSVITFEGKKMSFFVTPALPPEMALTQRELSLKIDAEGNLAGTAKVTHLGQEALVRRLKHLHSDEIKKKDDFEDELKRILPAGSKVNMKNVKGLSDNSPQVLVEYEVVIPGIITDAGDRMLMPICPLLGSSRYPFRHTQRKYPVYFDYPYREFDDIVIVLPENLSFEALPATKKKDTDFSNYSLVKVLENPQKIHIKRELVIKKSFFPLDQHPQLKELFDFARSSDEEQIVLIKK
jgi:hypothetical protein